MNIHEKRKAYAAKFVSYLISELAEKNMLKQIENIILFGSVAKNDAAKESDVDIFIEVMKKTKALESEIRGIEQEFYISKDMLIYKNLGIENKFNIILGRLSDWKELERSIMSTGIKLWGKYEAKNIPGKTKHKIIFYWDKIGKNRGAFLNLLYGFNVKDKHYKGILEKTEGERIGKSCIIIPIQYRENAIELFKKYDVSAKSLEVFVG